MGPVIKSVHYRKECKGARKQDYRQYRTKMKRLMYSEKYELLHGYKRTGGWPWMLFFLEDKYRFGICHIFYRGIQIFGYKAYRDKCTVILQ